jgi:coproporphyrinogen III oxidase
MASSRLWMPMARSAARAGLKKEAYSHVLQRQHVRFYNSKKEPEKYMIWRPYLRLAIGIPFISALIYSMVR